MHSVNLGFGVLPYVILLLYWSLKSFDLTIIVVFGKLVSVVKITAVLWVRLLLLHSAS